MSGAYFLFGNTHLVFLFWALVNISGFSDAVDYGKVCEHDDNCHDFRLICFDGTCICSRFYDWDPYYRACNLNTTELNHFLSSIADTDIETVDKLDQQAQSTFNGLGFAGILALGLGVFGSLMCVCLSCINDKRYKKRHKLKNRADCPEKTTVLAPEAEASPGPCFIPSDIAVIDAIDMVI